MTQRTHIELKARIVQERASAFSWYVRESATRYEEATIIELQETAAHLYATARKLMGVQE